MLHLEIRLLCRYNRRTFYGCEVIGMKGSVKENRVSYSPVRASGARTQRLGLRTTPAQVALIQRAAAVRGKSVTEFVLSSACEKAEQTLLDQRLFMVDEDVWLAFEEALDRPPRLNEALLSLISEPAPWEK